MNKFLVLTANLGEKDQLIDPPYKFDNCDYIAIVDRPYNVKIWDLYEPYKFSDIDHYQNRRNAKLYKILSSLIFGNYEYIFWHDSNHQLKFHPESILQEYGDFDFLLFKHPQRDCIYDEMKTIRGWLDDDSLVLNQEKHYIDRQMPKNYGLYEMTCFMKKCNNMTMTLDLMWWEQICKFSSRDQCSFMFCLWKMQNLLNIKEFNGYANLYAGGSKYFNEQPGHLN
jgi:hypothetical protein